MDAGLQFRHLARAEQHAGLHLGQAHHLGPEDFQPRQGGGKADGLGQTMFRQAAGLAGAGVGMQDDGAGRPFGGVKALARRPFGGGVAVIQT
ncbi:hypothetical protein MASR1M32_27820 [Rhodobacter sp.]